MSGVGCEFESSESSEPAELPELVAYGEHQRRRGLSPVTIDLRARVVGRLAAWLGRPLREASASDLRAFLASRRDQIGKTSQASEISYLKSFYAALVELELVAASPAEGLQSWRSESTRQPLSLLAVRALLLEASRVRGRRTSYKGALALRDRACLELLFATGLRASELCRALVVDLDLDDASILVRRAKRGVSRRLPLPAPAVVALKRYVHEGRGVLLAAGEDPGSLFLSLLGTPLNCASLRAVVHRVGERCGVKAFPHVFRRTLATEMAASGISLPSIQKVLGHASLSMTSEYVSVRTEQMREALEGLVRKRPKSQAGLEVPAGLQCRLFTDWQVSAA